MHASAGFSDWLRAATRPRLIGILVLLVAGALLCIRLGAWQLDRAQIRGDQASAVEAAERESAPPVPLDTVAAPQTPFTQTMVGQRVTVTGTYLAQDQFFVADRQLDGRTGYLLVTALQVDHPAGGPAILPVVRGWVSEPGDAHLDVPGGPVELTGYLGGPDPAQAGIAVGAATGDEIEAVSPAALANVWGTPIYSGQFILEVQEPAADAELAPYGAPVVEGGGLNIQNLAYAAEWWIFGGFALVLWWRMVRDEVRHLRAERTGGDAPATDPEAVGTA
ncbi:SURF1 family protein [Occultella glacieicola]|uniref:SURF1-like protein n=1 Tax=Occultella glacieicola TaxID=2518684 RepID=A0ABY2E7R4_9MICO|nr:SURF1 family protein [Occultella glacieicola]TDE97603.1 SURF1 family protein [Occultella glacieicola]